MVTEEEVRAILKNVKDPEVGLNIVDMGLIYGVKVDGEAVKITMTLTSPTCPAGQYIEDEIRDALTKQGFTKIDIELVWEPPWGMESLTAEGKAELELMRQGLL